MKKIYKYTVGIQSNQYILMSKDAQILSVQFQNDTLCLWAMVNPDNPKVRREIAVVGTGHGFDNHEFKAYLGSVQDSVYVWHIFDLGEK